MRFRAAMIGMVAAFGATGCGEGVGATPPITAPPGAVLEASWAAGIFGSATTVVRAVASFADGSSVVVGTLEGTITMDGRTLATTDGMDGYVARYHGDGTLSWVRRLKGIGSTGPARAVSVMTDGGIVVAGSFGYDGGSSLTLEDGISPLTLTSAGDDDAFIARYSGSGDLEWAKSIGSSSVDQALALGALPGGAVAVVGLFAGTVSFATGIDLTATGYFDAFVARFESNGDLAWAKATASMGYAIGWTAAGRSDGSVYVGGSFWGASTLGEGESAPTDLESTGTEEDLFVARFGSDGSLLWARAAAGIETPIPNPVTGETCRFGSFGLFSSSGQFHSTKQTK